MKGRMLNGFAVLRYYYHNPIVLDYKQVVYECFFAPNDPRNKIISKEEAMELIVTHNLSLVVSNGSGKVWE